MRTSVTPSVSVNEEAWECVPALRPAALTRQPNASSPLHPETTHHIRDPLYRPSRFSFTWRQNHQASLSHNGDIGFWDGMMSVVPGSNHVTGEAPIVRLFPIRILDAEAVQWSQSVSGSLSAVQGTKSFPQAPRSKGVCRCFELTAGKAVVFIF